MNEVLIGHPAYLAGLIDGEGCIQITRHRDKTRPRNWTYRLRVSIVNNHFGVLDAVRADYGGRLYARLTGTWQLDVDQRHAEVLLRDAYEWMIIKREQADIAFEFQATLSRQRNCKAGLNIETLRERERLRGALSQINQRRGRAA